MKNIKPLAARKPPLPQADHGCIDDWLAGVMPLINPVVAELDRLICKQLKNPLFAVKWSKAYYGTPQLGWCIELAAYHVSANVVFLNGSRLARPPELGGESRYVKIRSVEEANSPEVLAWIRESCSLPGWGAGQE